MVVEGLHDRQAVERAVRADVWVLGGERVARRTVLELQRAAAVRGVIVFTDPDGPGERIRRRVDRDVPGCKHAFLAKRAALGDGKVGVEHATPEAIRRALLAARDAAVPPDRPSNGEAPAFTLADLTAAGLAQGPNAALRRQLVGEALGIGYGNAKAFLRKLNALRVTRDEWAAAIGHLERELPHD